MRNPYRILVPNPEEMRPLGSPRLAFKFDI
jgi:hypothetical protein